MGRKWYVVKGGGGARARNKALRCNRVSKRWVANKDHFATATIAGSFDELFELHGLPKKSGTKHVCNTKKFGEDANLDECIYISRRGATEQGAGSPWLQQQYVAGNSEVFAPIVLGRSLETPENVLSLLKKHRMCCGIRRKLQRIIAC